MSDNYLHEATLQHRITELEELLRKSRTVMQHGIFVNYKDSDLARKLQERIDEVLGEVDEK